MKSYRRRLKQSAAKYPIYKPVLKKALARERYYRRYYRRQNAIR